jgi:hypothetical protein
MAGEGDSEEREGKKERVNTSLTDKARNAKRVGLT